MKRILLALIALFALFWFFTRSEPEKPSSFDDEVYSENLEPNDFEKDEEVVSKKPNQDEAPQIVPTSAPKLKVLEHSESIKVRKLPPGVVEFVLTNDNWAVAHGDILLGKLSGDIKGDRGQFKPKPSVLWESTDIPYAISSQFSKERVMEIVDVLDSISSVTNINFYMVSSGSAPKDYIVFLPSEDKCASYLGKIGGQQPLYLKDECGPKEIRHEAMHALGFVHEQSRKDRDQYVKINWENIEPGFENQFDVAPDAYLESYRGFVFAFDYESVMLYSPLHFSKDQKSPTIESITNKEIAPTQNALSPVDVQRINYLYPN